MNTKSLLVTLSFVLFCTVISFAQSPVGVWKTIDDETGEAKSHIEIYEEGGKFYGKVVKLLQKPEDTVCDKCSGDKKDKLILGMVLLEGLTPYKDYWSYGKILDPNNGKTYKCNAWFEGSGDVMKLRGYIGVAALGRNQDWHRVK